MAFTNLDLLLSKRDAVHDSNPCSFVRLGILLIFSFKDCMIFGAEQAISKQSSTVLYCSLFTLYGAAFAEKDLCYQCQDLPSGVKYLVNARRK